MDSHTFNSPRCWTYLAASMSLGIVAYHGTSIFISLGLYGFLVIVGVHIPSVWHARGYLLTAGYFLGLFLCLAGADAPAKQNEIQSREVIHGRVIRVLRRGAGARITIQAYGQNSQRIWSYAHRWSRDIVPGADVSIKGPFRLIRPALNPGDYNPKEHAQQSGVQWTSAGHIKVHGTHRTVRRLLFDAHNWAREQINGIEDSARRGILFGLVLGDRKSVPEQAIDGFQNTGTGHLLAVSGLHVGGIATAAYMLLLRLTRRYDLCFPHRIPALVGIIAAWLLVVLAQFPLSAVRAGIMLTLFLAGHMLGRRPSTVEIVSCAAVFFMLDAPSLIFTPGFLYSFGAVYALVVLCRDSGGPVGWLNTTWIASMATMPVEAWFFGTVSPAAPIANLILTPVAATVVVPICLLGVLISPWSFVLLEWASIACEFLMFMTIEMADILPKSTVIGQWAAPLFFIPVLATHIWPRTPKSSLKLCSGVACLVASGMMYPRGSYADLVSVGQGDAIVLYDNGKAALIDASPNPSGYPLIGYLKRMGISRLEWVLITHHHPDHFLGLFEIIEDISVGEVRHHGHPSDSVSWKRLMTQLQRRQIPTVTQNGGDEVFGPLHLRFFAPLRAKWVSENNRSISVRVDGYKTSMLLTGDLEKIGEQYLITQRPGSVDVLKAGHHGSRTSTHSALLDAVQPQAVIASLGSRNRHGFPHPEVIARLRKRHIPLYRTDENGRIRIKFDQKSAIETGNSNPNRP